MKASLEATKDVVRQNLKEAQYKDNKKDLSAGY